MSIKKNCKYKCWNESWIELNKWEFGLHDRSTVFEQHFVWEKSEAVNVEVFSHFGRFFCSLFWSIFWEGWSWIQPRIFLSSNVACSKCLLVKSVRDDTPRDNCLVTGRVRFFTHKFSDSHDFTVVRHLVSLGQPTRFPPNNFGKIFNPPLKGLKRSGNLQKRLVVSNRSGA